MAWVKTKVPARIFYDPKRKISVLLFKEGKVQRTIVYGHRYGHPIHDWVDVPDPDEALEMYDYANEPKPLRELRVDDKTFLIPQLPDNALPDWDVKVHKTGKTYWTEFHVGVQGFRLCTVEVDKHTSDEEAAEHAIFTRIMFLKALAGLGITKPGGVPDLKTALKQREVWPSPNPVVPRSESKAGKLTEKCCHGTRGCTGAGDKHWCESEYKSTAR